MWNRSARLLQALVVLLIVALGAPIQSLPQESIAAAAEVPYNPDPATFAPGVVHVKFKRGVSSTGNVSRYRTQATTEVARGLGAMALPVAPGTEAMTIQELRADPSVEYASLNHYVWLAAAFPNDSSYNDPDQDATGNTQRRYQLRLPQIPEAWDIAQGKSDFLIAVIDTGIYMEIDGGRVHRDLVGRVLPTVDFTNSTTVRPGPTERDLIGHGTAVAGVIAAIPNNGDYVAGINWRAKVQPIRAFSDQSFTTVDTVIRSIQFAGESGAKIVNMSLVYSELPQDQVKMDAFRDAVTTFLIGRNILPISAMGNFGQNARYNLPLPPSNITGVLAVGASKYVLTDPTIPGNPPLANPFEELSDISNQGSWISVVAPGENVMVLWGYPQQPYCQNGSSDSTDFCTSNGDRFHTGSSFATPIVTGIASLVWGCNPQFTPTQVRNAIEQSADKIGTTAYVNGRNDRFGYGRVNAFKALQLSRTMSRMIGTWTGGAQATSRLFIPIGIRSTLVDGTTPTPTVTPTVVATNTPRNLGSC